MNECCADDAGDSQRAELLDLYTRLAHEPGADFGWGRGKGNARTLGYAEAWLDRLPDEVWASAAAVGNPFGLGPVNAGETVVDVGCGAGADVCIAALLVGPSGTVIGVDCTPAMVDKAAVMADSLDLKQVAIQKAEMSALPLADATAELVISNGAINLAADKEQVLGEIFRILRPGGRIQIADMVRDTGGDNAPQGEDTGSWADCVAGTLAPETFLEMIAAAGFTDAELTGLTTYRTSPTTIGALFRAGKPRQARSLKAGRGGSQP